MLINGGLVMSSVNNKELVEIIAKLLLRKYVMRLRQEAESKLSASSGSDNFVKGCVKHA